MVLIDQSDMTWLSWETGVAWCWLRVLYSYMFIVTFMGYCRSLTKFFAFLGSHGRYSWFFGHDFMAWPGRSSLTGRMPVLFERMA